MTNYVIYALWTLAFFGFNFWVWLRIFRLYKLVDEELILIQRESDLVQEAIALFNYGAREEAAQLLKENNSRAQLVKEDTD